jgi:hypothetical protein
VATTIATEFFTRVIGSDQTSMLGIAFSEVITAHAAIVVPLLFIFFTIAASVTVTHCLLLFGSNYVLSGSV